MPVQLSEDAEFMCREVGERLLKKVVKNLLPMPLYGRLAWWFSFINALFRSRLLRRPSVFVVGDSHANVFRWNKPYIVFNVGSATAYQLKNPKNSTNSNAKLFRVLKVVARSRDTLLLVFGEVDCRMHIYDQYMRNGATKPISFYIDRTISNYGYVLDRIFQMDIRFHVHGVPPAATEENIYGIEYYPPPEMRSKINCMFNKELRNYCATNGYSYIDIYSKVVDEYGFIGEQYRGDEVHLNTSALQFIEEEMERAGSPIGLDMQ
jgi:lysophospholipase L1-like esterase